MDAAGCIADMARCSLPVFVTTPTIHETHRRILYDVGPRAARQFLDRIRDGSANILRPEAPDDGDALALIDRYSSLNLTLTDAVNMAVMRRYGILTAFTFDADFWVVGFRCIPPLL